MKNFYILFLFIFSSISYAQPNEGAIMTENGILMFNNKGQDSFTFYFENETDLDNFPFVRQNNKIFQFRIEEKDKMNFDPNNILNDYMKWEADHFIQTLKGIEFSYNEIQSINKLETNFWKLTLPDLKSKENTNPVKAMYFIDFSTQNKLFRIAYSSFNDDDNEAKSLLHSHVNNFKLYPNGIDFEKLIKNVKKGINYY